MKKLILIVAFAAGILSVNAQEDVEGQNDIMISPIELIAGPALNVSYERLLNKYSGIGVNVAFIFDKNTEESGITSQISPYYRMYFGKKYASGFFVEGFAPITMSNDRQYEIYYNDQFGNGRFEMEKNTTIGLGIGFGGKWVARRNIVFEASSGIARRFGSGNFDKITGKGMLGIGYRF